MRSWHRTRCHLCFGVFTMVIPHIGRPKNQANMSKIPLQGNGSGTTARASEETRPLCAKRGVCRAQLGRYVCCSKDPRVLDSVPMHEDARICLSVVGNVRGISKCLGACPVYFYFTAISKIAKIEPSPTEVTLISIIVLHIRNLQHWCHYGALGLSHRYPVGAAVN